MLSNEEAKMEMVLPLLVTDVMQKLEDLGKHPEADFTEKLRSAIIKIISNHPNIEEEVWDSDKKQKLIEELANLIEL